MAKPLDFVYTSKKEEHHICMPPTKEKFWNKILPSFLGTSTKMKNPYSWVTGRRKTTKYSKSGNPLDKSTKTLFSGNNKIKPMFSKTFQPPINSLRITTKKSIMAYFDPYLYGPT
jgi:hypothetical protein